MPGGRRIRGGLVGLASVAMLAGSAARQPAVAQGGGVPVARDTQPKGSIVGTVRDGTGSPVEGARVEAGSTFVAVTDAGGAFALRGLPVGAVVLTVRRIGYAPLVTQWDVGAVTLSLDLRVHAFPTLLPTVRVRSRAEPYESRLAGFNERREQRLGYYITQQDIERGHSFRMTDALQRLPGVRPFRMRGELGESVTLAGSRCPPLVMVDGFPASLGNFDLNMIDLATVEGVEVYPHGSSIPAALAGPYGMEGCGVIAIWSRPMRPNVRADQLPPEHPVDVDSLLRANEVFTPETVDEQVVYLSGTASPRYPDSLYRARVPGHVVARFVVDTAGLVELGTIHIVSATHEAFGAAVKAALRMAQFKPARVGGQLVRELVEMPFDFRPEAADSTAKRF